MVNILDGMSHVGFACEYESLGIEYRDEFCLKMYCTLFPICCYWQIKEHYIITLVQGNTNIDWESVHIFLYEIYFFGFR